MKLTWRVAVLSLILLTSCTLFVLLNFLNPTESSQVNRVSSHSLYRKQAQTWLYRPQLQPTGSQERSLLFAITSTETVIRSFKDQRIEELSAAGSPPSKQSTLPTLAKNVSRLRDRMGRVNSTTNTSTILKKARNLPAFIQNYEEAKSKRSVVEKLLGKDEVSNLTKVRKSFSQKQTDGLNEMGSKSVHPITNSLRPVVSTKETHHSQEHRSEETVIAPKLPRSDIMVSSHFSSIYSLNAEEQLVEFTLPKLRGRQNSEAARNKIMLTIRTTMSLHQRRLPVLLDTWLTTVNTSNVFLVTDGFDEDYIAKTEKLGLHYVKVWCGANYSRWSLCCKSGEEMSLMFQPEYSFYDWYCHMDDDVYLIEDNLVQLLSYFDAKNELVYLGRAGTAWDEPRNLNPNQTLVENTNASFHFAVGGMYCISRPLLEKAQPWLGSGQVFGDVCDQLLEPEDVTVGAVMALLLNEPLSRTKLIHPHGLVLRKMVNPTLLKLQVAVAYGCGQLCHIPSYKHNAVRVPKAKFSRVEDPSRFRSLHCHLHPDVDWCQVRRYTERKQKLSFNK